MERIDFWSERDESLPLRHFVHFDANAAVVRGLRSQNGESFAIGRNGKLTGKPDILGQELGDDRAGSRIPEGQSMLACLLVGNGAAIEQALVGGKLGFRGRGARHL